MMQVIAENRTRNSRMKCKRFPIEPLLTYRPNTNDLSFLDAFYGVNFAGESKNRPSAICNSNLRNAVSS